MVLSSLLPCVPRELVLVAFLVDSLGDVCQVSMFRGMPVDSSVQPGLKYRERWAPRHLGDSPTAPAGQPYGACGTARYLGSRGRSGTC